MRRGSRTCEIGGRKDNVGRSLSGSKIEQRVEDKKARKKNMRWIAMAIRDGTIKDLGRVSSAWKDDLF